jgi:hypothetical protein
MAFVPDTNHGLCSWHKPRPLFLAQTTAFVPGTNHGLCSWHKPRLLFLAQITTFVPGTNPRPLFLTQITAFVPGTNQPWHKSRWHKPPASTQLAPNQNQKKETQLVH